MGRTVGSGPWNAVVRKSVPSWIEQHLKEEHFFSSAQTQAQVGTPDKEQGVGGRLLHPTRGGRGTDGCQEPPPPATSTCVGGQEPALIVGLLGRAVVRGM